MRVHLCVHVRLCMCVCVCKYAGLVFNSKKQLPVSLFLFENNTCSPIHNCFQNWKTVSNCSENVVRLLLGADRLHFSYVKANFFPSVAFPAGFPITENHIAVWILIKQWKPNLGVCMCVYVYVCMCVYVYVCLSVSVYGCVCVCACTQCRVQLYFQTIDEWLIQKSAFVILPIFARSHPQTWPVAPQICPIGTTCNLAKAGRISPCEKVPAAPQISQFLMIRASKISTSGVCRFIIHRRDKVSRT